MPTYAELVDIHGPIRSRSLSSFRLISRLSGQRDLDLLSEIWPAWEILIADLLDAIDCPNCETAGELGEPPNQIVCPICDGDGWVYGRKFVDTPHPVKDPSLPPPTAANIGKKRPRRQRPITVSRN